MYSHVACDVMKERTLYLLKPSSLIWHLMPYLFLLRVYRYLSIEEGSLCLTSAAYPGSAKPMDKGHIPRDLEVFFVFFCCCCFFLGGGGELCKFLYTLLLFLLWPCCSLSAGLIG